MHVKPSWYYQQSAAVPFRYGLEGLEILLITSRKKKWWLLPKGIVEPTLTPQESAAKEAYEEAGVQGRVFAPLLDTYTQAKWGGLCTVQVYAMMVTEVLPQWPEEEQRDRQWITFDDLSRLAIQPALRGVMQRLPRSLAPYLPA